MKVLYIFGSRETSERGKTSGLMFKVADRSKIYEALKQRLFPRNPPSDLQFNLHMSALVGHNYDSDCDIVQMLLDRKHLIIEEDYP